VPAPRRRLVTLVAVLVPERGDREQQERVGGKRDEKEQEQLERQGAPLEERIRPAAGPGFMADTKDYGSAAPDVPGPRGRPPSKPKGRGPGATGLQGGAQPLPSIGQSIAGPIDGEPFLRTGGTPMTQRDEPETEDTRRARTFPGGPTGHGPATESRGDPETGDPESGAQRGAAAGAIAGTPIAGPIGAVVGGVIGGLAGAPSEAATDEASDRPYVEDDPFITPGSRGTGPVDPLDEPDPQAQPDPYDRGRG
jgi:hypothetical protein